MLLSPRVARTCCLQEVLAAQSIAQRGVMLVATTHGPSLKALLRNHTLNPLLGGIEVSVCAQAHEGMGRHTCMSWYWRPLASPPLVGNTAVGCWRPPAHAHAAQVVTIGDVAARESNSGNKTRLERKDMPTFAAVVEVKPGGRCVRGETAWR